MNDDRDVDARFREIIGAEFGPLQQADQPPRAAVRPAEEPTDFNLTAAMDHAEPDDPQWARYHPAPLPPAGRPRNLVVLASLLMGGGLLVTLLGLFGASFSRAITWAGIIAALVGLATLLSSTPRRRTDPWDDGARL